MPSLPEPIALREHVSVPMTFWLLREHAPARAVEPEGLRDAPALVEEEVEMTVDRIEPEVPYGACEGVERRRACRAA